MITEREIGRADWNKVRQGSPPTTLNIKDQEIRRFFDAAIQNINYLTLKMQDVRRPNPITDKDASKGKKDITKKPPPPPNRRPEALIESGTYAAPTTVDLVGKIHTHEAETTYHFQYMYVDFDEASESYPEADFTDPSTIVSDDQTLSASDLPTDITFSATGLVQNKHYYFQIVAENEFGTGSSNVVAVDTGLVPICYIDPDKSGSPIPVCETGEATTITIAAATLNGKIYPSTVTENGAKTFGTVNPNNSATEYYLKYGEDTTFGLETAPVSVGAGGSAVDVEIELSGLTENTTYYVKLVAINEVGVGESSVFEFRTLGAESDTLARFDYGLSDSYGSWSASQNCGSGMDQVDVARVISSLNAETLYHYRLRGTNDEGVGYGEDATFETIAIATPTGEVTEAVDITETTATINGFMNPHGYDCTVYLEYGLNTSYGSITEGIAIGDGEGNVNVSFDLTGLENGNTYHCRLKGTNFAKTGYSDDFEFSVLIAEITLTTDSLQFQDFVEGDTAIQARYVTITNSGPAGTTLIYNTEMDPALACYVITPVDAPKRDLASGESQVWQVAFAETGMTAAVYASYFKVTGQTGVEPKQLQTGVQCYPAYTGQLSFTYSKYNPGPPAEYWSGQANYNWNPIFLVDRGWHFTTIDGAIVDIGRMAFAVDGMQIGLWYGWVQDSGSKKPNLVQVSFDANGCPSGGFGSVSPITGQPLTYWSFGWGPAGSAPTPTASISSASSVTSSSANINGTVNPNGAQCFASLEYGTTVAYGQNTSATDCGSGSSDVPVTIALSGLSAGTTYHCRIKAINYGVTAYSDDFTFTTTA